MFDESCFTTDTVVRHEVKKELINYRRLEIQMHLVWIGFSCSDFSFMNILLDSLFMRFFIFKVARFVRVKRFYTSTLLFFALLGTAFPLKTFCHYIARMLLHSTKILQKKIKTTPDTLN